MTDYNASMGYSPGSNNSFSDVDDGDISTMHPHRSSEVNELESAYKRRDQAKFNKAQATNIWVKRTIFCSCLLIITSGVLLISQLWYANILGIAGALLGIWGAYKKQNEFVFVYLVLLGLEALKNIGVFFYYIHKDTDFHDDLLVAVLIIEEIFLLPPCIYQAFFLHRTLSLEEEDNLRVV